MIIPIGTDNPLRKTPLMNYALVAVNVVIFLITHDPHRTGLGPTDYEVLRDQAVRFMLNPESPRLYQFISYAFLHADWMHLLGNMLFLYIFGNNVNDKLGHLGYLLFYLGGGICSGLGHALLHPSNVLGASGAVAAVTGAYMVLFPKTYVRIIYIIFFIGTAEFPAFYFILLKLVIWDNVAQVAMNTSSNIAYSAHLVGYAFGIGIPMALLALKLLPHSHFDLWAVAQRWRRREKYRRVVEKGYDPYSVTGSVRKTVNSKVVNPEPLSPQQQQILKLRADISQAVSTSNMNDAIEAYIQLLEMEPEHVLPQQPQLDIANKLAHLGRHNDAAQAYELFIKSYPRYPFMEQVQLMLGLIYSRYLKNKEKARQHLQAALEKISSPTQRQMCQDELDQL